MTCQMKNDNTSNDGSIIITIVKRYDDLIRID